MKNTDGLPSVRLVESLADGPLPRPGELSGRLVARRDLGDAEIGGMFRLLASHFAGVEWRTFCRDLEEKNWVLLIEDEAGGLRGFSTILIYETQSSSGPHTIVYSGDTIVERAAWGTATLPRTWIRSIHRLRRHYPTGDLYWLLLTSGYRTYRFLPVFWRTFFPRFDEPIPPRVGILIDELAVERFGRYYDRRAGIVRFPRPQVLHADLLDVPDGKRADPHVDFFLSKNPGYVHGDELVCLTRLEVENLTPAGRRMVVGRADGMSGNGS